MSRLLLSLTTIMFVGFALNSASAQGTNPPQNAASPPQPKIVGSPVIIVDRNTGAGAVLLNLRNSNPAPTTLDISLTGTVNTSTNVKPTITFKDPPGEKEMPDLSKEGVTVYRLSIPPDQVRSVLVMATKVSEAGEYEVELSNRDDMFGKVKIINLPFAVTLDGPNPNEANLSMVASSPTTLTLKNDDPVAYPLIWRLSINGREVCGDKLTLAAKGLGLIQCHPSLPFSPTRIQDLFKVESTKDHSLVLYPEVSGWFDKSSPWKRIPVTASLSYFGPTTQQFGGFLVILVVLLAGGLTSLILSQALPNRLKRLNIKERLMNTSRATANLSSKIGSRFQVLLRLERSRLFDLLESRYILSPDFAEIVSRCNEGIDKLQARVVLVQQIDVVLEQLDQKLTLGPPPSQICEIEALIDGAKVLLMKTEPTDKDLEAAKAAIAEAARKVDNLNRVDPAFGESLAKKALDVQNDIKAVASSPTFVRITKVLPGPYAALQGVAAGTTTIAPASYTAVDMAVEKMLLLKDYVIQMDGTQDQNMLDRLAHREKKLLDLLQLQSWPAMRSARLLLREMKDDVYPERLEEKLIAGAATIVMEPLTARDKAPLEFCICFHADAIDEAAAKEEWTCEWAFGDNMNATGWSASHYYTLKKPGRFKAALPAEYTVEASFRNSNGDPLVDGSKNLITVKKQVQVQPSRDEALFGDRTVTELVKLAAALLIAVFALVAGAREQLLKLDILPGLVAVFMVGFSADTIKNLLTKAESTPTP